MNALASAGAGFLLAVLWFDLMFDVQARIGTINQMPRDGLASICAYYRRVTFGAVPMNRLISLVMLLTLGAIAGEIYQRDEPAWLNWVSLGCALSAIGLAAARTVRNARRLGGGQDAIEVQTKLAQSIYRDHLFCFAAIAALLALQLSGGWQQSTRL
ncbi:MAG: hypothetical protein ABSD74_13600 [Rhizomicrobium sp.]